MIALDDFRIFLPKYLSEESTLSLFHELTQFPLNIDARFYSNKYLYPNDILQGDGLNGMLLVNLPDTKIGEGKAMTISNSCDLDTSNSGLFASSICYCPIINLHKYETMLKNKYPDLSDTRIPLHIQDIRAQRVSQIFFLPSAGELQDDSFVFLDKICNCDNLSIDRATLNSRKIFTLSNYGFYLFLFKLSIHFTRIRESIDRT